MTTRPHGAIRLCLACYRLLLRAMPKGFRDAYGSEAVLDLEDILEEARRFRGHSVFGTALRAYLDLMRTLPGEWWAASRPPTAIARGADGRRRPGMGERVMDFWRELRLAGRSLSKRPGFSIVAALTLALGIGANVAIFSIVNAVLLRPLAFQDSHEIVAFRHHAPGLDLPELQNSDGMLNFYAEYADYYAATAAYNSGSVNLTGGDEAARVEILSASPEIFEVLRVQPMMGRPFTGEDADPEAAGVALLGYETWRARFGSDPSVLGRMIELDGESVEVIGVMPAGFAFPDEPIEMMTPHYVDPDGPFGTFGTGAVARLSPGITPQIAEDRSTELLQRVPDFFPQLQAEFLEAAAFSVTVESLRDAVVADVESTLWIILGTVAFVLLIACANVANLFLVRAESRQKEMAVRAAMGAGRRSVATSFLSESLILGIAGGIVGVLFASGGVRYLLTLADLPRAAEVAVDGAALMLALLLSVAAGLTFGAIPLTRYAGSRFAAILRDGGRANTVGRARHRARNLLVASQLALGLVLLIGSGLMLRSFAELRAVDLGFEAEGVVTLALNRNQGESAEIAARFYQDAADRITALPGVSLVGISNDLPLASGNSNGGSFYIQSAPRDDDELPPVAMYRAVGSEYFPSMGIPILSGRAMERADWEEPRAAVWINQSFAETFFDGDPLGELIAWGNDGGEGNPDAPWAEIVGVVGNVREFGIQDEDLRPFAYFPLLNTGAVNVGIETAFLSIKMEEGQDPRGVVSAAQTAIRQLDAQVPITATRTMQEIVGEAMEGTSATMIVLAIATVMALFLGAIGLAGVISYVVGQRTREIGVRVALGAESRDVSGMIVRQSLLVTAGGMLFGLAGAFGLTRLMEAILFEVSTTDPVTFATAPIVLLTVSLLATWLPARKASRVDPIEALRAE